MDEQGRVFITTISPHIQWGADFSKQTHELGRFFFDFVAAGWEAPNDERCQISDGVVTDRLAARRAA